MVGRFFFSARGRRREAEGGAAPRASLYLKGLTANSSPLKIRAQKSSKPGRWDVQRNMRSFVTAILAVYVTTVVLADPNPDVCTVGVDSTAAPLNGGPWMMDIANAYECRALCEDHELCGAFSMKSRVRDGW